MLISLVLEQMEKAQRDFSKGSERKAYVMSLLSDLAVKSNYPLDDEDVSKISKMIDEMCDMANIVGVRS